ncbi:MBL fold metallo-hydrolase [Candidatus Saccharibacteria bacterium]|nr:MBL fold metallo-hydrolase [Candidatus Saccharibacteria bacterium]NIW80648.1 MBL fold metallo-hydrolase [Calditrichia bacterium]
MSHSNSVKYILLGGEEGIGASAHYLQFDRCGIMLDAGSDPHTTGEAGLPQYSLLKKQPMDAIVITHAHFDHIGSLPVAIQHFPYARVYMTPATVELTEQMLFHYLQVQRKKGVGNDELLYDEEFLEKIHFIYQSFDYESPFPLHSLEHSGIQFAFYDAGHILGSAGVLIEWKGKRIFYTGNTRNSAQFILKGAKYPEPPVDVLITESTYGANPEAEKIKKSAEVKRFAKEVSYRLRVGGVVLLPVFALGRTQEMLTMLHRLRMKNRIPTVPIYITGMGLKINKTYDRLLYKIYPEYRNEKLRAMTFDRWNPRRKLKGPAILLATSGMMLPGTASFDFARELVTSARNGVYFVGYADSETPGGLFREQKYEALKQLFEADQLAAQIEIFQFSAHSNRQELLSMIKQMKPLQVIFTHGDRTALQWMQENTRTILPMSKTMIPEKGQWYTFFI